MSEPAPRPPDSGWLVPGADPRSIREGLPAELRAEFDAERGLIMDRAKVSMELAGVRELLWKWRHLVVVEWTRPRPRGPRVRADEPLVLEDCSTPALWTECLAVPYSSAVSSGRPPSCGQRRDER